MFLKWLPWRYLIKNAARSHGLIDPVGLLARFTRFGQPAETMAPIELIRSGMEFHARGLINNRAIQHNMDWVWPYWVVRQFDRTSDSFIPRGFTLTHINLTGRNWTAVGIPDEPELAIVDPAGLVTPFFDGWSLDSWLVTEDGEIIPSRGRDIHQTVRPERDWSIETGIRTETGRLTTLVSGGIESGVPVCRGVVSGIAAADGWCVVSLRPCNPEGISFVHDISWDESSGELSVNGKHPVRFDRRPDRILMSTYEEGDVYNKIHSEVEHQRSVRCETGLATCACLFKAAAHEEFTLRWETPLVKDRLFSSAGTDPEAEVQDMWKSALDQSTRLSMGHASTENMFRTLLKTLILHTPAETMYAGPYTYRSFWFRDAVYTLYALLATGLHERAGHLIPMLLQEQSRDGYFHSQEGEWDSNGQVLWILKRYLNFTGTGLPEKWTSAVKKGAEWIIRKVGTNSSEKENTSGLLPAGYSAEHFGPNDLYYWDDFWSASGLFCAADILEQTDPLSASEFRENADKLMNAVSRSLKAAATAEESEVMRISPNRRFDSAAVGTMAAGYPLRLLGENDPRLVSTARRLMEQYGARGAFFHEVAHSGINAYLSLHIAQVLLRAGKKEAVDIFNSVTECASSTDQWPEALHPRTGGGCMGDGQHIWAASEWIIMLRNSLIREERGRLILCSGLQGRWFDSDPLLTLDPAPTEFGPCRLEIERDGTDIHVNIQGEWFGEAPEIEIRLPGAEPETLQPGKVKTVPAL